MKIAACIKWVPDPDYPLPSTASGVRLDVPGLTYMASPVDMVACEAAVRLKEGADGSVNLVTAGPAASEAALRSGLALGADHATRLDVGVGGFTDATRTARVLATALAMEAPDIIVCGSRSPDSGAGAVPAMVAEWLGMPLVTHVVSITGMNPLVVERRLEGGRREVLHVQPPVVIAVEESLCEPRYPPVLARRKADRADITVRSPAELGIDVPESAVTLVRLQGPRPLATRLVAPPHELSARERLAYVLAGGPDQRRTASRLEGPPSVVIDQVLSFLEENGAIGSSAGGNSP